MTNDDVRTLASLVLTSIIHIAIIIAMVIMFAKILAKLLADLIKDVRQLFSRPSECIGPVGGSWQTASLARASTDPVDHSAASHRSVQE